MKALKLDTEDRVAQRFIEMVRTLEDQVASVDSFRLMGLPIPTTMSLLTTHLW